MKMKPEKTDFGLYVPMPGLRRRDIQNATANEYIREVIVSAEKSAS